MKKEQMITIILGGSLGKIFGYKHKLLVNTTSEAIRALCCTIKGFERYLNTSKSRGLTYTVFRGKVNLTVDELGYPITSEAIKIMPVIIGSKRGGLFQTIFGAVLVAAAVFVSGGIGAAFSAGGITGFMATTGAAMALGGVIQMLSPQPSGLAMKDSPENKPSYAFGSPTNTVAQGYPVPVGYGQRRIGGAVISAGIYVEDQQ